MCRELSAIQHAPTSSTGRLHAAARFDITRNCNQMSAAGTVPTSTRELVQSQDPRWACLSRRRTREPGTTRVSATRSTCRRIRPRATAPAMGCGDKAPVEWSSMRPGGPTDADQGEPAAAALAPTRAETAIRLLRATKAVDSPTWKLPLGDRTASSGRAAPKKTTAIRMITSILQPHSGSISVLGHACALAAKDRSGYRPEERGLYRK